MLAQCFARPAESIDKTGRRSLRCRKK